MPADNNLFQKNANVAQVLRLIWEKGSISRADISRDLSLYRSTVSNITSELIANGVVVEGEHSESTVKGGRKAVALSINKDFGCVIGISIQPSHFQIVIMGMDGRILWEDSGMAEYVSLIGNSTYIIEKALKAQKLLNIPLLAISFSIPGIINTETGRVISSWMFNAEDVDFKGILEQKFGYPIYIENDANCAAWYAIQNNTSICNAIAAVGVFHENLKVGSEFTGIGLGCGLVIDGKVYHGSHNSAGEFRSASCKAGNPNQSGLPSWILDNASRDRDCLKQWMVDTLASFVPVISMFDCEKLFLYGSPFSDMTLVREVIASDVPQLAELLDKNRCEIVSDERGDFSSASGAAIRYMDMLFSIPKINSTEVVGWNRLIGDVLKSNG